MDGLLRLATRAARGRFFLLAFGSSRTLVELVDATGRVEEFLLSGKQRMARGANLDADFGHRRTGRKGASAGTVHAGFGVPLGMDLVFHSLCIIAAATRGSPRARFKNGIP